MYIPLNYSDDKSIFWQIVNMSSCIFCDPTNLIRTLSRQRYRMTVEKRFYVKMRDEGLGFSPGLKFVISLMGPRTAYVLSLWAESVT